MNSTPAPEASRKQAGPPGREAAPPRANAADDAASQVPCRSTNPAAWKYALLAAVFVAWAAFLVYCAAAGN